MKKLDNYAFVTGATGGIGMAICERLAKENTNIIAHYNSNEEMANNLKSKIESYGVKCIIVKANLSIKEEVDSLLLKISEEFNLKPKLVINNAGITKDTLFTMIDEDSFDLIMKINTYASFYIMKWAARYMARARSGSIINISSISGQIGNPGQGSYSASKGALLAMTKTLAKELAPRKVKVNAIAAGLIETEMVSSIKEIDKIVDYIPMKRMGTPEEIAAIVEFLSSDNAAYLTGQTLNPNGGLYTP